MAVFGMLKRGHKAAKEHSDKQAAKDQEPPTKYHHIPTHAASDALMGAPAGWNKDDVSRIREANRRRSAMEAHLRVSRPTSSASMLSPMHLGSTPNLSSRSYGSNVASSSRAPAFSRSVSGLSQVSYPAGPSNPVVQSRSFSSMDAELHRGHLAPAPTAPLPAPPTTSTSTSSSSSASFPANGQSSKDSSHMNQDATNVYSSNSSSSSRGDALEMRALRKPTVHYASGDGSTGYYYNEYAGQGFPATNLNGQQQQQQQQQQSRSSSKSRSSSSHTLVTSSTSSNIDTPPLPSAPLVAEAQTKVANDVKAGTAVTTVADIDSIAEPPKAVVHEAKPLSPVAQKTYRLLPSKGLSFKPNWPFQSNTPATVTV